MEKQWAKLEAFRVSIDPERSRRKTDKEYAKTLMATRENTEWQLFYQAVEALERGCGYSSFDEIGELLHVCVTHNSKRTLQVIEQKQGVMEIVVCLRCVPTKDKFEWVENNLVSKVDVLFEILRQLLSEETSEKSEQIIMVSGLCQLLRMDSKRFRYLFQRYLLNKHRKISVVARLMESMPRKGWEEVSNCVFFGDVDNEHLRFWDQCGQLQSWEVIFNQAEPIEKAWISYIDKSIRDRKFGMSLYNDLSNIIINILSYELTSYESFCNFMNEYICSLEKAMCCWFESGYQQRCVFLAHMSVIEHMRYVWIYNQEVYGRQFPETPRKKILFLIKQFRFLWDDSTLQRIAQKELRGLRAWIETVC